MSDRNCPECIWKGEDGLCHVWDCNYITRSEAYKRLVWNNVNDKLPDPEEYVLCCTITKNGKRNIVRGYYTTDHGWVIGMYTNVTHWLPLPEVPNA